MKLEKLTHPKNLILIFIPFFMAFFWIGYITHWTFSEVHPSLVARHLFSADRIHYLFSLKPLYNFLLFVSYHVSTTLDIYPVLFNRMLFVFNGVALSFLLYLIVRKKTDTYNGLLALLIFISSHIFLTRGFRVRSDLLISTLGCLSLFLSLKGVERKTDKNPQSFLILALLLCMLLISPKGVYWLCWVGLLLKESLNSIGEKIFAVKRWGIFIAGTVLVSFIFQDPFFTQALRTSILFYIDNLQDVLIVIRDNGFFSFWKSPSFFSDFIFKNPQIILIIFLKAGFVLYQTVFSRERKWNLSDASFALLLFFFIFHPQKKPFFFCALTPWFVLHFFTDPFYIKHRDKLYSLRFRKNFLIFLFVYGAMALFLKSSLAYRRYNNFEQRRVIGQISRFFQTFPSLRVYDPHAFLIHPQSRHWFLGPYEGYRVPLEKNIQDRKIDVVFNAAGTSLDDILPQLLKEGVGFVNVQNYVYYRSLQIPLSPTDQFSGKVLLQRMEEKITTHFEKKSRLYWYMFLDEYRRPFVTEEPYRDCVISSSFQRSAFLESRCVYSQKHFIEGITILPPEKARFLALFYIPPPRGVSPGASVKSLLMYDMFF